MNMAEDHILSERFNKPSVCFLFLMSLSVLISLFGRTAISWVVDLSSFGAIVGFGYVSAATYRAAKRENSRRGRALGTAGAVLAAGFAAAQLIPGISLIEMMKAESYLLLAFWCLLGFAFYWRTMRADPHESQRNETLTIAALFFLLIFSVVIWYIKMIIRLTDNRAPHAAVVCCSVILLSVVLLGLVVMLLIHSKLQEKQMLLEREKIRAIENSCAYCDKKNLTRVLLNLVSNAYKFTPKTAESRWRCSNVMRRDTTMSS